MSNLTDAFQVEMGKNLRCWGFFLFELLELLTSVRFRYYEVRQTKTWFEIGLGSVTTRFAVWFGL